MFSKILQNGWLVLYNTTIHICKIFDSTLKVEMQKIKTFSFSGYQNYMLDPEIPQNFTLSQFYVEPKKHDTDRNKKKVGIQMNSNRSSAYGNRTRVPCVRGMCPSH